MIERNTPHLDDFTLLRYIAEDLNNDERRVVLLHLQGCESCRHVAAEIDELDRELKALTTNPDAPSRFRG
jgi:anti-sigma factor RsiW